MKATPTAARSTAAADKETTGSKSKPRTKPTAKPAQPSSAADHEEAIRLAAYALYEARGCVDGHALDDWETAKTQLAQSESRPARAAKS